jgi:hypothetical protein
VLLADTINKTGNVRITWRSGAFVQPLLQWKSNYYKFWVCICSLSYPACHAYAPYCHLWPVRLYNISPHYLINGTIFENGYWTQNVFWFILQIMSETFFILIRTKRNVVKKKSGGLQVKYLYFLSDFNETWIFWKGFRKIFKFHENPSSEGQVVPCRRTDGQTHITKIIVTFRNFANAL